MKSLPLLFKNHPEAGADFPEHIKYELGETEYVFWSVHEYPENVEGDSYPIFIFNLYYKYVTLQTTERHDDEATFKQRFQSEISYSTEINEAFFRAIDRNNGGW